MAIVDDEPPRTTELMLIDTSDVRTPSGGYWTLGLLLAIGFGVGLIMAGGRAEVAPTVKVTSDGACVS